MTREIKPLPPELTELLFESGERKIVLVEGESDVDVFEEWYSQRLADVVFHAAQGHEGVRSLLERALSYSQNRQIFGIVDRDFRDDVEVELSLTDGGNLFVLRRYALENYLIEPQAVHDVARTFHGKAFFRNNQAAEAEILRLCRVLKPVMATNWVLTENAETSLPFGFDLDDREHLLSRIAQAVPCSSNDAEIKLSEKEAAIEIALASIETAHKRTNGKHLLNRLYIVIAKGSGRLDFGHLRRLLRDRVQQTAGIHKDIREIVDQKVLGLT